VDGDEAVSTNEDMTVSGNVLANATDIDSAILTVTQFQVAGDTAVYLAGQTATITGVGSLTIGATGAYSFTPAANYAGAVPAATYTVADGNGGFDTSTLQVFITPVNDAPVDGDEAVSTNEDMTVSGNVLTNATDVDSSTLTVTQFQVAGSSTVYAAGATATIAGVGSLTIGATGAYSFTPAADYAGAVPAATYTVSDSNGGFDTSTLQVSITPVNDAPVDSDEAVSTNEDMTVGGNVLTNATDVDSPTLTVTQFQVAGDAAVYLAGETATIVGVGSLTIAANGAYNFTPVSNYAGAVPAATYTVSDGNGGFDTSTLQVSITPVNDAPVDGDEAVSTERRHRPHG
jgi:large repetitive protein